MDESRSSCCLVPSAGCCAGLFVLFACIVAIPAACLFVLTTGGPDPLYDNVEFSESDAAAYESVYDSIVQQAAQGNREFTIRFTDQQFMSWINLEFQDQLTDDTPDFVREDTVFQVRFEDETIQSYVGIKFWDLLVDIEMAIRADFKLEPAAIQTPNDKFDVTFTRFEIGRLSDVSNVESDVDEGVTDALTDQLKGFGDDYEITDVQIGNGSLTITGVYTGDPDAIDVNAVSGIQ